MRSHLLLAFLLSAAASPAVADVQFVTDAGGERLVQTAEGLPDRALPTWCSLVPAVVAIVAALCLGEVVSALSLGLLAGALILGGLRWGEPYTMLRAGLSAVDTHVVGAITEGDHAAVIVFSLLVGAVISVVTQNGGMAGVAAGLSRLASTPRRAMSATWGMGLFIFFDDYANSLVVGQTMRPITDRQRVSREKLAYLVDSTAAPIAATAFVSTWIGAELGYIADGLKELDGFPEGTGAYGVFLGSLKYCAYPIATLAFTLLVASSGRDFGPMRRAESLARQGRAAKPAGEITEAVPRSSWLLAAVPVLVLVAGTLLGLVETALVDFAGEAPGEASHWSRGWAALEAEAGPDAGPARKLGTLLGRANSFSALMWSSAAALITAILLSVAARKLSLRGGVEAALDGFKIMLPTMVVLTLAWALSSVVQQLHAAEYLTAVLKLRLSPAALPAVVFVLAAGVAFVTGTSWGTMAILFPLVIPLAWRLAGGSGDYAGELLFNTVAVTLSGAVLGDHCSPISDTTVLSSMAAGCDHLAHVRTQMPYALLVGSTSVVFAGVSAITAWPLWVLAVMHAAAVAAAGGAFWLMSGRPDAVDR